MADESRFAECRFIVIAMVNLTHPALSEAIVYLDEPKALAEVVAHDIRTRVQGVDYLEAVGIAPL